jgi:hypothetical protein
VILLISASSVAKIMGVFLESKYVKIILWHIKLLKETAKIKLM